MTKDVTRREAMKTALKAGAYAAPVVVTARVPLGVAAATPTPTADILVLAANYIVISQNGVGFQVAVTNTGPSNATGVVISAPVPPGLTFTGATAQQGTYNAATGVWTVGSLVVGAAVVLTLYGAATAPRVTLTATRTASSPTDPNPANDSSSANATFA